MADIKCDGITTGLTNTNKYGVWFKDGDIGSFAYNWLGAKVSFLLLGQKVFGEVKQSDSCYHTLDVEFNDKRKFVTVNGHFNCFTRIDI